MGETHFVLVMQAVLSLLLLALGGAVGLIFSMLFKRMDKSDERTDRIEAKQDEIVNNYKTRLDNIKDMVHAIENRLLEFASLMQSEMKDTRHSLKDDLHKLGASIALDYVRKEHT